MAGTTASNKKTAQSLKERDPDYYRKIGAKGGKLRKKPYYYFQILKETDPEKFKELSTKASQRSKELRKKAAD